MLIAERPGRIRLFKEGRLSTYAELPVYHRGESGLLGLALHPGFPREPYVYAYRTVEEGGLRNQVVRLRHLGERGVLDRVVLDGIPARPHGLHSGGRIAFGPDGMLYVATGEVYEREMAQDLASLGGRSSASPRKGSPPRETPSWGEGGRGPRCIASATATPRALPGTQGPGSFFLASTGQAGKRALATTR
ncbi:oxidoreductase [Thermus thermophilus]|nr:oxidoreductase [Thermus thermophilus]